MGLSYVILAAAVFDYVAAQTCTTGKWKLSENAECQQCGRCVDSNGQQVACDPNGGTCNPQKCATGYYGDKCLDECGECLGGDRFCMSNGTCRLGCKQGYKGAYCNQQCLAGKFGENCAEKCGECQGGDSKCDKAVGACSDGCVPGWSGLLCRLRCPDGRYGLNCNEKCGHCLFSHQCNKDTGTCTGGCKAGYQGPSCTMSCPRGMYGANCAKYCTGCAVGCTCDPYTGQCEKQPCTSDKEAYGFGIGRLAMGSGSEEEHHGSMRIATPALIVAVAALLVGLAALGAVTYYRRHKKSATSDTAKEKEEADDVETYENVGSPVYKKPVHRH